MRSAIILLAIFTSLSAQAQTPTVQSGKKLARIKEATVRRVLPGRPETPITFEYKLTIAWLSNEKPQAFFFYVDSQWRACLLNRYKDAVDNPNRITKGDEVDILPINIVEAPVKNYKPANNTILFKTKKNKWLSLTVKNLIRKPDLALP